MGKLSDSLRQVYTTARYGNELEKALSLAADHELQDEAFCQVLLSSDIYVLVQDISETKKNIILAAQIDGKRMIPIFSSTTKIYKFIKEEYRYTKIKSKEFFALIKDTDPVVLNPGDKHSKTFGIKEVARFSK